MEKENNKKTNFCFIKPWPAKAKSPISNLFKKQKCMVNSLSDILPPHVWYTKLTCVMLTKISVLCFFFLQFDYAVCGVSTFFGRWIYCLIQLLIMLLFLYLFWKQVGEFLSTFALVSQSVQNVKSWEIIGRCSKKWNITIFLFFL